MGLSRFEDDMTDFCRRSAFKQYVRDAINDELFWNKIFSDMRINNQVDNALNNKVPEKVRNYLNELLPGKVSQEIMNQLPNILSNNYQMQQLLNTHKDNLKTALDAAARVILARITNEDQYHEVNKAYFEAFDQRSNDSLTRFDTRATRAIKAMEDKCNHDLINLHSELENIQAIHDNQKALTAEVSSLRFSFYVFASVSVVVVSCLFFYYTGTTTPTSPHSSRYFSTYNN